jgi:hypothetical protein
VPSHWLREQYQSRQRSLKDIAAETGISVRRGISSHAHPLASVGGPDTFPAAVWNTHARPNAEQRIRGFLTLPSQLGLHHHAARQLGIRHASLASQVRQLEATTGTTLLRTGPDDHPDR